jgi:gluconolactonase
MRPRFAAALLLGAACLFSQSREALDFEAIKVERIVTGYSYLEAPAWSREGFFLWSDVPANKIWKWVPGQEPVIYRDPANKANGLVYDAKGELYIAESAPSRVVKVPKKGDLEVLADKWEAKALNSPNAVVVRKDGQVYFTDPAFGTRNAHRELDFYGVYHVTQDRERKLEVIAKLKGRPNGIALSPNGRILYVANSDERAIYAYDLGPKGEATNERVAASKIEGVPGGLAVDEFGNIFVAAKGLHIYSPVGVRLHTIEISEEPSDIAWGDGDFQTLLVTARSSIYRVRLPWKGSVQY